jgi:hypothetical protein
MGGKITGRVEILVNGTLLLNKAGASITGLGLSGQQSFERNAVVGDSGIHGFVDTPIVCSCEVTVTDRDDIKLDTFAQVKENGTIIFRAAGGGKSYVMEGATCMNNFTLTAGEGETTLRFVGNYWTEQTE